MSEIEKMTNDKEPDIPALIVADLIDADANTKFETITGKSICQLIYSAFAEIYMRYSDHTDKYPSFKGIRVSDYELLNENKYINIMGFDHAFKLSITKIPEEYDKLQNVNGRYDIRIEDNFVSVCLGVAEKNNTVCEIVPILIPYAFLDATDAITSRANDSNYKDLHDTIFGFNLLTLPICYGETTCIDPDIFCFQNGFDIAYKKAMAKKISLDIKNEITSVKYYKNKINSYCDILNKHSRTLRRCKRSLKKIIHALKDFRSK